jgi:hypothetical protein
VNQFNDYDDIFGKAEIEKLRNDMEGFFKLSDEIRRELGKKGYLLDKYIAILLEGMNETLLYEAAEEGFMALSRFRNFCLLVMDGKADCSDHPLYEKVKEYIDSNPLNYQEKHVRLDFYCIALHGCFSEHAAEEYASLQYELQGSVFDIVSLRELYTEISALTGGEQMEKLNFLMRRRFLMVTPMTGFIQGMTGGLLYSLTYRDDETFKTVAQLWLDNI